MAATRASGQSYIIKRPRLTKLLDETSARIILLCAPAGYGKTTLAREWVEGRGGVYAWYEGSPEMLDPVALQSSLAASLGHAGLLQDTQVVDSGAMRDATPSAVGRALALAAGGAGSEVLVLDDYQFALTSAASDALLAAFVKHTSLRLVLTSRARPSWVTSRSEMYGDALLLGADELAFNEYESSLVLSTGNHGNDPSLQALARGWPAVIGLAARRGYRLEAAAPLPSDLFRYLADDFFASASASLRRSLFLLALAQTRDAALLEELLGPSFHRDVADAAEQGFATVNSNGSDIGVHPLIQAFLLRKLRMTDDSDVDALVSLAVTTLREARLWDECLQVLVEFPRADLLCATLQAALADLVASGRVTTISRWLTAAKAAGATDAIIILAEAEVALCEGDAVRTISLGEHAAELFSTGELAARGHLLAARGAHLLSDEVATERNLRRARELAAEDTTRTTAKWVEFLRAVEEGDLTRANDLSDAFQADPQGATEVVRARNAKAWLEIETKGNVQVASAEAAQAYPLLAYVSDPFLRTNFLNLRSSIFVYLAEYELGIEAADELIREARLNGLDFVVDHALLTKASAEIGLRHFSTAHQSLSAVGATGNSDFVQAQKALKLSLLRIATGDLERADLEMRDDLPDIALVSLLGEWYATRSLIRAALGDCERAISDFERARRDYRPYIDCRNYGDLAEAIVAIQRELPDAQPMAARTINRLLSQGHRDAVIHALRAYPPLATLGISSGEVSSQAMTRLLAASRDISLGRSVGLEMPREHRVSEELSPREREVYELLLEGRTNREIGETLFISQSTAKVHVKHIFEKLGVHSRAEAAALVRKRGA
jgi:ATP/maltotriose-dependent transcriptional regulator MalT